MELEGTQLYPLFPFILSPHTLFLLSLWLLLLSLSSRRCLYIAWWVDLRHCHASQNQHYGCCKLPSR